MRLWKNSKTNSGQNSMYASDDSAEFCVVPTRKLYDILISQGVSEVGLLKIDVEGYEDKALLPFFAEAPKWLWPKAVLIEHAHRHMWNEDCVMWMKANGYQIDRVTELDSMLVLEGEVE